MAEMTSRERMLGAMRRDEVDRVPVSLDFWTGGPPEQQFHWDSIEERIAWMREWGFDPCLYIPPPHEGHGGARVRPHVKQRVWRDTHPDEPYPILHSEWTSPQGSLSSRAEPAGSAPCVGSALDSHGSSVFHEHVHAAAGAAFLADGTDYSILGFFRHRLCPFRGCVCRGSS